MPKLIGSDLRSDICGIREMITDYVENVSGGVITLECDHNWELVGCGWDSEKHQQVEELARASKIELEGVAEWGVCERPFTEDDLAAVVGEGE